MKTKDEILKFKERLQNELDRLPDYNAFGEDNSEDKEELRSVIDGLDSVLNDEAAQDQEINDWLNGEPSLLDEFFAD